MKFPRLNLKLWKWRIVTQGGLNDLSRTIAELQAELTTAKNGRDAATKQVEILTERVKMRDATIQRQDDKLDALELKLKRLEKAAKPKPAAKARVMKATKGKKAPVA